MTHLAPEARRALAIALLLMCLGFIVNVIITPLSTLLIELHGDIAAMRFEKARLVAIASRPQMDALRDDLRTDLEALLLRGDSTSIAQAQLQTLVADLANRSNIFVNALTLGPIQERGNFLVPTVELVGEAAERDYVRFLQITAAHSQLIQTTQVTLNARRPRQRKSDMLDIRTRISGYWLPDRDTR
ncbi:MAG: hypothetical protein AAF862_06625 [Pseudomonadota bacterium]